LEAQALRGAVSIEAGDTIAGLALIKASAEQGFSFAELLLALYDGRNPLSQVRQLAELLKNEHIDQILCSDLKRCRDLRISQGQRDYSAKWSQRIGLCFCDP
jgi:hypothetical protein